MRVGWLADEPGYLGGAELTQREFRDLAPDDVEVVDCPPGGVAPGLDRYVVHNCASYSLSDVEPMGRAPVVKYVHDSWPAGDPALRDWILESAERLIFTSQLHVDEFPHDLREAPVHTIPPAIDLGRFRDRSNGHRLGNVCVGRMAYGKGVARLEDWPEPVDVWSPVRLPSRGSLVYRGSLEPEEVPEVLSRYRRFVFLPTALEPFGRAVVEAWAAGLELVVNRRVGAAGWIERDPEALALAGSAFWRCVRLG